MDIHICTLGSPTRQSPSVLNPSLPSCVDRYQRAESGVAMLSPEARLPVRASLDMCDLIDTYTHICIYIYIYSSIY